MASPPTFRVFVYGTLLRGEPNHRFLARASWVGPARTQAEFELVDLGRFPAMVSPGRIAIVGELYDADESTLSKLDALEGHPHFYGRTEIVLEGGHRAQAYLLPEEQARGARRITSGDWRLRRQTD